MLKNFDKIKHPCRECDEIYIQKNLKLKESSGGIFFCFRCWNKLFYHKVYVKKKMESKESNDEQTT